MSKIEDWELDAALEVSSYRAQLAQWAERLRKRGAWVSFEMVVELWHQHSWDHLWSTFVRRHNKKPKKHKVFVEWEGD